MSSPGSSDFLAFPLEGEDSSQKDAAQGRQDPSQAHLRQGDGGKHPVQDWNSCPQSLYRVQDAGRSSKQDARRIDGPQPLAGGYRIFSTGTENSRIWSSPALAITMLSRAKKAAQADAGNLGSRVWK